MARDILSRHTMHRRTWIVLAVVVTVLALGALWAARRSGSATVVDVGTVATRDVFRSYVTASGEVVATRFADIGSSVMGRIVALTVAEGDRVSAGQVLARIDPVQAGADREAAVEQVRALESEERAARQAVQAAAATLVQAHARAREARLTYTRITSLHADGVASRAELDAAQAASEAADAQVGAAQAERERADQVLAATARRIAQARAGVVRTQDVLAKTEIVAPIGGVVTRLQVRLGEMVVIGIQNQPGTTLMTVSDLSAIDAEIKVAEADVMRVAVGQTARLTLEAVPGKVFAGRVVEVGASALPVVGTGAAAREFRVVVRMERPDPGLRPGLTCDAEILTAERTAVLTVPLQAVALRAGPDGRDQSGVFVVRDGRAVFSPVRTGIIGGLDIEVAGLAAGTPVVIGPYQILRDLKDGTNVRQAPAQGR